MSKIRYSASSTKSKFRGGIFNKKSISFPLVSGGTLHSDATYYYRKFIVSDNLTITGSLIADILVIAGGGSGGSYGDTGGGGAGTISYSALQNLSAGSYACQVAAVSGRAARYDTTHEGNPSQFGSFQSVTGGGQGYSNGYGGGSSSLTRNGGASRKGGGGASGPALPGPVAGRGYWYSYEVEGTVAMTGGNGINTYSSWASATNTGVNGYYAGGGSASSSPHLLVAGGLGGGGSGAAPTYYNNNNGGDAVANTGSGGGAGGSYYYNTGGNGSSGLIIVRYTREQVGG